MTIIKKGKVTTVAICGLPNSGKSTLLNYILEQKVAITSFRPQTTRTTIKGIYCKDNYQIVFYDTPGIFLKAKTTLEQYILKNAWSRILNVNELLMIVDCSRYNHSDLTSILQQLKEKSISANLVLNKIDMVNKDKLLIITDSLLKVFPFEKVFMISAKHGHGISDLLDYVKSLTEEGVFLYPEDQITDIPMRYMASEVTREKIFLQLKQELPYKITVATEKWENTNSSKKGNFIKIEQVIYVTDNRYKKIILGKNGSMIKKIGTLARQDLEASLESKIYLALYVKEKDWIKKESEYSELGVNCDST